MEQLSKLMLNIHIFCGFASVLIFWLPIFTKKGGKAHRLIGKAYVFLMWIVVITAALLSIENFAQGQYAIAVFLGFLALITSNPLWYGIAILNYKKGLPAGFRNAHLAFNSLIFICGLLLLIYGIYLNGEGASILMIIFGILGLSTGGELVQGFRNPQHASNWFKEHYKGMVTTAIAAYTAFFVFGGSTFFKGFLTGYLMVIPWVMPTIIGFIIMKYMGKKYDSKLVKQ